MLLLPLTSVAAVRQATDFPLANHLFVVGRGRSSPSEYIAATGHVSSNVIDTIVDWIGSIR